MVEFDKEKEARLVKKAQELANQGWNVAQISRYFGVDAEWIDARVVFKKTQVKKPGWFGIDEEDQDEPGRDTKKKR